MSDELASSPPIKPAVLLVPTPIGNLEDISLRALRILRLADIIAAEDTRHSLRLLKHYTITAPLVSLHSHNEHQKVNYILDKIVAEKLLLAVVSDAGTPGISDPGYWVAQQAILRKIHLETLPGATAFVPALLNSGLPADRFCFEGFLPLKKGRQKRLLSLQTETRTMIFYESPLRIIKTLAALSEFLGANRPAAICRELTKIHEQTIRGTLAELIQYFETHAPKGEFVIVVGGKE